MGRTTFSGPIRTGKYNKYWEAEQMGYAEMWQFCDIPIASITGATVVYPTNPIIIPAASRITNVRFYVTTTHAGSAATLTASLNGENGNARTFFTVAWADVTDDLGVYDMGYAVTNFTFATTTAGTAVAWKDVNTTAGSNDLTGAVKVGFAASASIATDTAVVALGVGYIPGYNSY